MLYRYFCFDRKRIAIFTAVMLFIFVLQYIVTGSMVSRQNVTTEAGNANSSVIGIIDNEEVIRQKFSFDRKVVLSQFVLSFGSFERENVGDTLNIQMTDGDNNVVYETDIDVDDIKANESYTVNMDHTVTIPKGVVCCIRLTCKSDNLPYAVIPTLNTTNRTDPNTYMSTLKMQTRKKSLNISYTYSFRQIYPLIVLILEICILFIICFEHVTDLSEVFRKKRQKIMRRSLVEQKLWKEAGESRAKSDKSHAKVKYSESKKYSEDKRYAKDKKNIKSVSADRAYKDKKSHKRKKRDIFGYPLGIKSIVRYCISEPKILRGVRIAMTILNPLVIFIILEAANGNLGRMYFTVWPFTWILLLAIQFILYAVIGNMSIAVFVMDIVLFPFGLGNLFIMKVRGTPLLPADIFGLATAAEVASTYSLKFSPAEFILIPAFIIWIMLVLRLKKKSSSIRSAERKSLKNIFTSKPDIKRLAKRFSPVVVCVAAIMIMFSTGLLEACGVKDNVWNKVASCRSNGFYMNFFINLRYLKVAEPAGYSKERVAQILESLKEKNKDKENEVMQAAANGAAGNNEGTQTAVNGIAGNSEDSKSVSDELITNSDFSTCTSLNGKMPNIILIMNESLADFSLIGDVNYNRDPLEYIHSMKENTIKGLDYVSVFGAGTSNSEFEAMTGNTMSFFPSGCNVYQQFMHDTTYSISSYLKSLGYTCNAIHPSSGANWNRVSTYQSMKFDRFVTIEDFVNPEYVRYISDKESYKKVIELYEANERKTPMFMFDMTIQNHGGYLTNTNWEEPVYVEDAYYDEAKEFLSATKVSDDAFKYLINYFEKIDDPTIIFMFGDHWPSIETKFFEDILGKEQSEWELEDIQKRYATPFVLWANYDIEEAEGVIIGNNLVENLLLKQAGIELPLYNQYVEEVSKSIPVMNVNGYMDKKGVWHKYGSDETEEESELIDNYKILQYGYYSDTDKETMSKLFEMEN